MEIKKLKSLTVLFKAHQHVLQHVKQSIANMGLNINEFTVLEALYVKDMLTAQQLASTILIPNSSLTYVLDCLQKKGLIKREKNKTDSRILELSLSKQGEELFYKAYEAHYSHMRNIFNVLDETQELQLQDLLKTLGKHAQNEVKK